MRLRLSSNSKGICMVGTRNKQAFGPRRHISTSLSSYPRYTPKPGIGVALRENKEIKRDGEKDTTIVGANREEMSKRGKTVES